jgi:hypothetical protein
MRPAAQRFAVGFFPGYAFLAENKKQPAFTRPSLCCGSLVEFSGECAFGLACRLSVAMRRPRRSRPTNAKQKEEDND